MGRHKGQSIVLPELGLSSSPCTTSFTLPELVQTKSMPCGLTMGAATATPIDNTNQTSTQRVMCMA